MGVPFFFMLKAPKWSLRIEMRTPFLILTNEKIKR